MKTRMRCFGLALLVAMAGSGATGCGAEGDDQTEDELRVFPVSKESVDEARRSGDPAKLAKILRALASDRTALPANHVGLRIERAKQLFEGMQVAQVGAIRAAYIAAYAEDPEITIRSDGLAQPLARLQRADELEMVGALNAAQMTADAAVLDDLQRRATSGPLSAEDRQTYFAMLPRMGLWDAPVRAATHDHSLDALERTLLGRALDARRTGAGDLDTVLRRIEARLPQGSPKPPPGTPRSRAIAVVASSHGAQWQELMGWAKEMLARGYHLQVFTAEGRPVAFQRDSLSVSVKTVPLGFGCPADLDPAGRTGELAAKLLGNTAGAATFDPSLFGAVYLAGGLGFNEDVAVAHAGRRPDGSTGTVLAANPNVARMMQSALGDKLPLVAICHGPTLFAAIDMNVDGHTEPVNKGINTASLPPFESYVGFTGRKEIQFTYDVNTHEVLGNAGGNTNVAADIANMSRVVEARKLGVDIITGPGPQAASALAQPTMVALQRRWGG